jgi:multiple sugar transport system ATP-binding protein
MSSIEFRQISKRYPGNPLPTIHDATLQIETGEFCVFVGPSGCGKSTLLRMVAGLEDITSGEMFIEGQRINDIPPAKRGVAMVFQSYALYPHMTVRENMAFGLQTLRADKAEITRKVQQAADILQLAPLLDRLPKHLSGGQRQRVAIGRAIVKEPRVFLFDEPLSNLDAALRVQTRLEIAKLHKDLGSASMIYVTHDQVEAMTLADKIVLLHTGDLIQSRGSIAQVGSPMALYHRPASLFVAEFVGSPKMNILSAQLVAAQGDHASVVLTGTPVAGAAYEPITAAVDASAIAEGSAVKVGIRPEHLLVGDEGPGAGVRGRVVHVERLGEASLLYIELSSGQPTVTARIEGTALQVAGQDLTLRLRADQLHLFGADGRACSRTLTLPS